MEFRSCRLVDVVIIIIEWLCKKRVLCVVCLWVIFSILLDDAPSEALISFSIIRSKRFDTHRAFRSHSRAHCFDTAQLLQASARTHLDTAKPHTMRQLFIIAADM